MYVNIRKRFVILFTLLFVLSASFVYADGGDGSGDGDGQGNGLNRNIPLTLKSSSVDDGATNVAVNETIQLSFNKNICNITVLSNNRTCFHLTDEAGEAVSIKLIFPDTQVQKDYRREVFIKPAEDLDPNTSYEIAVDSTLIAKNGMTLDNAHVFSFTTGTSHTNKENAILEKLGENVITYETVYGKTADSVPVNQSELNALSEDSEPDTGFIAKIAAAVFILILIVFIVVFLVLRRKPKA